MHSQLQRIIKPDRGYIETDLSFDSNNGYVIHATQAYTDPLSLRRTAEIVAELLTSQVARLVCIEEVSGEVSLAPLLALRARRENFLTPGRLIETGEIGYLEYLFLTVEQDFDLWGVEDASVFKKAIDISRSLTPGSNDWERRFTELITDLNVSGLAHVSGKYADFCRSCGSTPDDLPPLELLIEYADHAGLESADLRNFEVLLSVKELEQTIDFTAANREREEMQNLIIELITDPGLIVQRSFEQAGIMPSDATPKLLMDQLSSATIDDLSLSLRMRRTALGRLLLPTLKSQQQKGLRPTAPADLLALFEDSFEILKEEIAEALKGQGKDHVATARVFNLLMEFMALLNIEPEHFPNLILYAHYLNRLLAAQVFAVPNELNALRIRILSKLSQQDMDRLHASLLERLSLLTEAFQLKLTRHNVKRLQTLAEEQVVSHEQLCADLARFFQNNARLNELKELETEYTDRFDDAMRFYNLQDLRADEMVDNTRKRMRDLKQETAILVTGGFHQNTIAASLARHRISHTVVFPVAMPRGVQAWGVKQG